MHTKHARTLGTATFHQLSKAQNNSSYSPPTRLPGARARANSQQQCPSSCRRGLHPSIAARAVRETNTVSQQQKILGEGSVFIIGSHSLWCSSSSSSSPAPKNSPMSSWPIVASALNGFLLGWQLFLRTADMCEISPLGRQMKLSCCNSALMGPGAGLLSSLCRSSQKWKGQDC